MSKETKKKDQALIDMSTSRRLKTGKVLKENGYDTVPKLIRNIINPLITLLKQANNEHDKTAGECYKKGMYLLDEPFIPEYAGFDEMVLESKESGAVTRVYSRGPFLLCRNRDENTEPGKDKWILKNTETQAVGVYTINNMFDATVIMVARGVDITVLDIVGCKFVN